MSEIQFVTADKLKKLDHYAAALVSGMITLRTLESFHIAAFTAGLLDEGEENTSKTICFELHRLMGLYKTQMENILERVEIDEIKIIESLKQLMPDVKTPRKKRIKEEI